MRIVCRKGFYKFYPESPSELSLFADKYGQELVRCGDYWTFPKMDILDYSIKGQPVVGLIPAIVNYAGTPAGVFAENKLIYSLDLDMILMNVIQGKIGEQASDYCWVVPGIPQAYGVLSDGSIATGFDGWLNLVLGYTTVSWWESENI